MKISRRDFLKWSIATAVALNVDLDLDRVNTALAAETDPPIIWLNGAGCSGCTISTLNVTSPTTIDNVLTSKISLKYDTTLMTAAGNTAMQVLDESANLYKGQFILVIEGAIPTGASGNYCIIGEQNGSPLTMQQAVLKYGPMAKYVVAAGTCASFGGVSGASSLTECKSVVTILDGKTTNPVINLSGCPVHPTILVQTLIDLSLGVLPAVDTNNRPSKYYGITIHRKCERLGKEKVNQPGVYGCYKDIGCKGPQCSNVCPTMKWNNGVNFCITANYPCIGCANPTFPTNPLVDAVSAATTKVKSN
ncbi:periplasmic [NiFeSe] hydrogenase small subunit precursor [Clostridium puniceum]|uniref:Periplasmic [NiFeSe] hydrogenase small subunit n=1 Tax=Clostridium puniceum TaxID=29367 RepID=A0A1S8TXI5_9CLOT|nr:hydrogenase small subunit [Clostridium puniceum]OOM82414.1 periplasmic [NiFeSe] hydrogenase small subunit precursor [Clostridium puniceum]